MILIISTCKKPLHELEFVKPIENILKENKIKFFTKHYSKLNCRGDLEKADKIIICGTSLQDYDFLQSINSFTWISESKKPILGICAGMQIISLLFGAKLKKKTEIGFYKEDFTKEFLSLKDEYEVYHLHNNYTTLPKQFNKFASSIIPQAIKHKTKNIFGVLFHPEVRNKKLIEKFIEL
jgi:GMP synthase (glutamine-hydrolysing)